MPVSRVVVDASVALRAISEQAEDAVEWLRRIGAREVRGDWPQLAFVEIANGLATLVRAGELAATEAAEGLERVLSFPIASHALDVLAGPALSVAVTRSVSAYDACYVVLAEAVGATLVTADRRLAAVTDDAVLLAG
jgi:predicted nucleic acid-binding protein